MNLAKFLISLAITAGLLSCGFFKDKVKQTAEQKIKEELQKQIDENLQAVDSMKSIADSLLNTMDIDSFKKQMDSTFLELQKLQKELEEKSNKP